MIDAGVDVNSPECGRAQPCILRLQRQEPVGHLLDKYSDYHEGRQRLCTRIIKDALQDAHGRQW